MTNQQLYLAIGLPCFTIIVSLVISLVQISGIKGDIREIRQEMSNMKTELRAEIAALRDMLVGKIIEHGERLAKLEK